MPPTITSDNIGSLTQTLQRINELRDLRLKLQTLMDNEITELKGFFEAYEPSTIGAGTTKVGSVACKTNSKGAKLILGQCIKAVELELRSLGYRDAKVKPLQKK